MARPFSLERAEREAPFGAAPGGKPRLSGAPSAKTLTWRDLGERSLMQRSWIAAPFATFSSLLIHHLDDELPKELEEAERPAFVSEEEEEEEGEEESTESEPEPEPMEEEFDGVLDEGTASEALHNLGRSASGTEHVYLNLSLTDRLLSNVSVLSKYVHLEKLDLSHNRINDLSCVSYMPHLLDLDVSHNELTTYFDFSPPKNLQVVNFSYNEIPAMRDLSAYQSLKKLILDNNNIEEICGLEKCQNLTYLSLANNRIAAITGLQKLPIKTLCLKSNQIEKAVGLEELKGLRTLDLSDNRISSLEGLEEHNLLEEINLEDNQIGELGELEYVEALPLLRTLNLLGNPVQQQPDYWLLVIFMLLRLTELDHKKITVEEKVAAVNKYDPPPEVVAAQDHMTHITYSMMQPQRIYDSTLPSLDAPYPMLVLTGPLACWKRELCHRLCRKFNNYFRYSPCHTTRTAYFGEENRLDYYFVSQEEFDKMLHMGKFIATFKYSGFQYGLGRDTIDSIAREGLATCTHLEIEGVRSLKNSYFEPRYILLIPMNKEKYGGHLRRMGLFSRPEIEEAVRRVDMYNKVNQDLPGFFDAVINVDDHDEAFTKLTRLIEEFLGLVKPTESEVTIPKSDTKVDPAPEKTTDKKTATNVKGNEVVAQASPANEFLDSSARNYAARISAKLSEQKTPVEEASLHRRQQMARQGLMGKASSSYSQLFPREGFSTTVAAGMYPQYLEPTSYGARVSPSPQRRGSSDRGFQSASSDQSSRDSRAATRISLSSPGGVFSSSSSSGRTPAFNATSGDAANGEHVDGKDSGVSPEIKEKKPPKSKGASPRTPQVTIRPGSNTKPVLPPIPSGRKKINS
ncbi:leucine-rich repeat and guanylate kinase domain-containing protein [Eublepharis macularius]|uniref:Leucine-rich repeat and guanylate kinase domain-containing protein n=1 Tax=Eublepharis macularius TaxID=481883 RepID=A0AA97JSH3_EUBMA|nr:leucine-rich repeat and guanylate kinase domain-containing protein [Eublepharis macularius]